jgi:hypothetical protein
MLRNRAALILLASAGVLLALFPGGRVAVAAPSPSSLNVTEGSPAQTFNGGPITGSADGSGNAAPVVCPAPSCESIPLTLGAPSGFPAKSITLTVTISFSPPTGNPGGLGVDGLDIWVFDAGGTTVASATLGSSPATAIGEHLDPGAYTIEISGENAAANVTYTGSVIATQTGTSIIPTVTQSPVPLAFAPATVVSPALLGAEPQISFENPVASPKASAGFNVNRGFIDWPISSRVMIGTLWRTLNGGDSYRELVDLTCGPRQVPNCQTGGGGDTVNRVNGYDATVNFGTQESLVQEAFASSVDHGDSFPIPRQAAVTSTASGVDRQWISTVDAPGVMAGTPAFELEALFSYHIPAAGELVAGIGTDGIVRPAAAPVIPSVTQSGPSRIDEQPGSHGKGWFYQSYRDGSSFKLGVAPLASYDLPTAYTVQTVTGSAVPQVFPWIALDRSGNLYAVWVEADGQLYYSFSSITDAQNDPTAMPAGVPGTHWSTKLKVNPPNLGSSIFPEVVAGDAGRIAITYMATGDFTGLSDNAPSGTKWNTYVALSSNAMDANPVFQSGLVSHRVPHIGSICTSGTTCPASNPPNGGDRSLLDMIDVTMDSDGRAAAVFTDNNNLFARQEQTATNLNSQGEPYVKVAKLSNGPSLLSGHGPYALTFPTDFRSSAAGDATWPNTAAGTNIAGMDILGSGVSLSGSDFVGTINLADASTSGFTNALTAYNNAETAANATDPPATRLQYVLRWDFGVDAYYMVAEVGSNGIPTYYGGRVDSTNGVNAATAPVGIAYRPQSALPVSGSVQGNTLTLHGHLADFTLASGSKLVSFAAYSLVGPADTNLGGQASTPQVFTSMRTVDASPPMDAVIGSPGNNVPETPWVVLLVIIGATAFALGVRRRPRAAR